MPVDHRLAGSESVTLDDTADEPPPQAPRSDPVGDACRRLAPGPTQALRPAVPLIKAQLEIVIGRRPVKNAGGGGRSGDLRAQPRGQSVERLQVGG